MATRTVTTLVDDLDGSSTAEENVVFGLDRVDYEIDLSSGHAETLREVLAPYVSAARRTGGRRATRGLQPSRPVISSARGAATRSAPRTPRFGRGPASTVSRFPPAAASPVG